MPFFKLMGTAALLVSGALILGELATNGAKGLDCKRNEVKWVVGRGVCDTCRFVLAIVAAALGAGVGDIGALSSINTVVAALLGRLILKEPLGPLHITAVGLSVAGAVLISNPENLSGNSRATVWIGYCLALLSGTSWALSFICSRKSLSATSTLITSIGMLQRGVVCWAVSLSPLEVASISNVGQRPVLAASLLAWLFFVTAAGNYLATFGGKRCPAAVSATLMTATSMVVGYGAQVFIFDKPPTTLALIGASLMFFAVVAMTLARLPPRQRKSGEEIELEGSSASIPKDATSPRESLASFVAAEYAERMPPPEEEVMPVLPQASLKPRPSKIGGNQVTL